MSNIVERLRDTIGPWTEDAADEIERLQKELRQARELLAESKRIWSPLVGDCLEEDRAEEEAWEERLDAFLAKSQEKET